MDLKVLNILKLQQVNTFMRMGVNCLKSETDFFFQDFHKMLNNNLTTTLIIAK